MSHKLMLTSLLFFWPANMQMPFGMVSPDSAVYLPC
jgi:hypothetical protein